MHDVLFTFCVVGVDLNLNAACPSYLCNGDDIPHVIAKLKKIYIRNVMVNIVV